MRRFSENRGLFEAVMDLKFLRSKWLVTSGTRAHGRTELRGREEIFERLVSGVPLAQGLRRVPHWFADCTRSWQNGESCHRNSPSQHPPREQNSCERRHSGLLYARRPPNIIWVSSAVYTCASRTSMIH